MIYLVLWISWACPGGPLTNWIGPVGKRLLCEPEPRVMQYPDREQAEDTVRKLGCDSHTAMCEIRKNGRLWCEEVKCEHVVKIGGES